MPYFEIWISKEPFETIDEQPALVEELFREAGNVSVEWDLDPYRDYVFGSRKMQKFRDIVFCRVKSTIVEDVRKNIAKEVGGHVVPEWAEELYKKRIDGHPLYVLAEKIIVACELALEFDGEIHFVSD